MSYPEAMSEIANYPKALSHAETGGGDVSFKTLTVVNESSADLEVTVIGAITDGKYGAGVTIPEGETAVLKYIEPVEAQEGQVVLPQWALYGSCSSGMFSLEADDDNVTVTRDGEDFDISIFAGAEDGAVVTFSDSIG